VLIAIGLIFRSKPAWTTVGAWAAVPVIVVSLGFGYVSFRSVSDEGSRPTTYLGTAMLELTGDRLGSVSVSVDWAQCQYDSSGAMRLVAGREAGHPVTTDDGTPVFLQFDLDSTATKPSIQIVIGKADVEPGKGWDPGTSISVAPGTIPRDGSVTLTGLVPLTDNGDPDPTERWSGTFSWSCSYSE
jgi:hypothetical protein